MPLEFPGCAPGVPLKVPQKCPENPLNLPLLYPDGTLKPYRKNLQCAPKSISHGIPKVLQNFENEFAVFLSLNFQGFESFETIKLLSLKLPLFNNLGENALQKKKFGLNFLFKF